jgi:hypothetical protein
MYFNNGIFEYSETLRLKNRNDLKVKLIILKQTARTSML